MPERSVHFSVYLHSGTFQTYYPSWFHSKGLFSGKIAGFWAGKAHKLSLVLNEEKDLDRHAGATVIHEPGLKPE